MKSIQEIATDFGDIVREASIRGSNPENIKQFERRCQQIKEVVDAQEGLTNKVKDDIKKKSRKPRSSIREQARDCKAYPIRGMS